MNKVVYKQGSFTNYEGILVNFIMAAVSIPTNTVLVPVDENGKTTGEGDWSVKMLSLGIAVQRPGDTWNLELGQQIAYGKALKRRDHILVTNDPGLVNTKMVEAVLEQEVAYMQVNPGRYIAGYDEARDKYLEAKSRMDYYNSLTDEVKTAIKTVASLDDTQKFIEAVDCYRSGLITDTKQLSEKAPASTSSN